MDCIPFSEKAPDGYPVNSSSDEEFEGGEFKRPSENQRSHRRQEKEPLNWFKNIFKKKNERELHLKVKMRSGINS